MSWSRTAARSLSAAVTAILNFLGRKENSGWSVDHCRTISHQGRGSSISSAAAPANWSEVTLRTQLPEVWMACISTEARSSSIAGMSTSPGQLNWMFCRVVKCP